MLKALYIEATGEGDYHGRVCVSDCRKKDAKIQAAPASILSFSVERWLSL